MVRIVVILIAHDRTRYLVEALRCLQRQTLPREFLEVVIVKNFVLDEADRIAADCGFKTILSDSIPAGEQILLGMNNSSAELICLLDDDDLFVPTRLETVLRVFTGHPRLGFFSNSFAVIAEDGSARPKSTFRKAQRRARVHSGSVYLESPSILRQLGRLPTLGPDFNGSSIAIRRSILTSAMLDVLPRVLGGGDTFLFYCAVLSGWDLLISPEILTSYRLHPGQLSLSPEPPGSDGWVRVHRMLKNRSAQWTELANELFDASDDPDVGRSVRALAAFLALYSTMLDPNPSRMEILESAGRIGRFRDTYTAKVEPRLLIPTLMFLASPRMAQWLYHLRQEARFR